MPPVSAPSHSSKSTEQNAHHVSTLPKHVQQQPKTAVCFPDTMNENILLRVQHPDPHDTNLPVQLTIIYTSCHLLYLQTLL
jgi:hypothetical protein